MPSITRQLPVAASGQQYLPKKACDAAKTSTAHSGYLLAHQTEKNIAGESRNLAKKMYNNTERSRHLWPVVAVCAHNRRAIDSYVQVSIEANPDLFGVDLYA